MTALKQRYLKAMGIDVWVRRSRTTPEPDLADSPAFHLGFVAYDGLGFVFSAPPEDDAEACRQLYDDIARAVTGKAPVGKRNELKWPPAGDEQNANEAGEMVRRRLQGMPRRIVAFGELVRDYVLDGNQDEVVHRLDKAILGAPDIGELLDEPLKKRELWSGLVKLKSA